MYILGIIIAFIAGLVIGIQDDLVAAYRRGFEDGKRR